ncbi:hypothetical protein ACTFIR_009453 [Dictyostelium discoideum]|jgi:hypothetical protein
MKLY